MRRLANLFALGEDLWTTGPVNRAVDATAAEQRRVGGVNDRGYVVSGNVAGNNPNAIVKKRR
jgi:hypothetical protein